MMCPGSVMDVVSTFTIVTLINSLSRWLSRYNNSKVFQLF